MNDYYSTSDLALATAISLFFPLDSIDRSEQTNKARFVFQKCDGFDEVVERFWSGSMRVSPQEYFFQLKMIKTRLYEGQ